MFDEPDDDFEDDDDLGDLEDDPAEGQEPPAEPESKAKPKAKPKADAAPADPAPDQSALAELGLNALKQSFIEDAKKAGYITAEFDGIGLTGIDDAAKAAFLASAKASHEAQVEKMKSLGFVLDPAAASAAEQQAALDAQDAQAAQQWGPFGPGAPAGGDEKLQQEINDEVAAGDAKGVIQTLLGKGEMGKFILSRRR